MIAENGYTQDEMYEMTDKLKEQGLVTFLRNYLSSGKNGEIPKFRKLLLGFGVIPVRLILSLFTYRHSSQYTSIETDDLAPLAPTPLHPRSSPTPLRPLSTSPYPS